MEKCVAHGLGNPQFRFYRNGYDLVINSWQVTSQDGADFGGYSGQYVGVARPHKFWTSSSPGGRGWGAATFLEASKHLFHEVR